MIPDEIIEKYCNMPADAYPDDEEMYQSFLFATNDVTSEIIESLVSTLADSTALNFITNFIGWLKKVSTDHAEVLRYRAIARTELNKIRRKI